jgi:DNA-binding protein HU-beta
LTKQELIEKIAKGQSRAGRPLSKKVVGEIVDAVFGELGDYFVRAKLTKSLQPRFTYPGFGTFVKRRRSERLGRHPQTHEPIVIPSAMTLIFTPGQDLKDLLNRSGSSQRTSAPPPEPWSDKREEATLRPRGPLAGK